MLESCVSPTSSNENQVTFKLEPSNGARVAILGFSSDDGTLKILKKVKFKSVCLMAGLLTGQSQSNTGGPIFRY